MFAKYKNKLVQIFEYQANSTSTKEIIERGFCFSEFQKKKLLFIGMNPSYVKGSIVGSHSYSVADALIGYNRHYGKFQDLVNETKYENDWTYIDLFYFRETEQFKIGEVIKEDVEFIIKQLQITDEIINEINPEIIVVCNSGASNFFGINKVDNKHNIWLGYDFKFDENLGIERIIGINKNSILDSKNISENIFGKPFLFSSTLTYLDNFNKKRMKWIIKKVGENINKENDGQRNIR